MYQFCRSVEKFLYTLSTKALLILIIFRTKIANAN